jgi:hypothetical protein
MDMPNTDPEITILGLLAFMLATASLSIDLLSHVLLPLRHLPFVLALSLGFVGAVALYADSHLDSRWSFWIVLAKDIAIGAAFLMLGLAIGCGQD